MTDIGEKVAVTTPEDPEVLEQEDTHWVEVEYKYQSGAPVEGWCQVTDSSGTEWSTVLNDEGKVCLSGLPPGQVQVSLLPDPDNDNALQATRKEIKAVLDGIIADQKAEAAAHEAALQQQSGIGQAWTHVTAFGSGLWNGAVGLVQFVGDAAQWVHYLSPLNKLNNALSAAYDSYKAGELTEDQWHHSLAQRMQDKEFSQLAELLGFDVRDLDREKLEQLQQLIVEAYETAAFIADDAETQQMLEQFAKDFAGAQSSVEWAEFSGGGVFEIVLAALLAAFTGGIGIAAQAASKLRHAAKLKSLGGLFRKLAKQLKRKKMGKEVSADVDASKAETAEMPEGPKPTHKGSEKQPKTNPVNIREESKNWSPEKRARFERADTYYKEAGYVDYDSHLRGIDFDRPVKVVEVSKGEKLYQYSYPDRLTGEPRVGAYYYKDPDVDVSKLGFEVESRNMIEIEIAEKDEFLQSTAANIEDWNGSGKVFSGGETQLFNPNAQFSSVEIIK